MQIGQRVALAGMAVSGILAVGGVLLGGTLAVNAANQATTNT